MATINPEAENTVYNGSEEGSRETKSVKDICNDPNCEEGGEVLRGGRRRGGGNFMYDRETHHFHRPRVKWRGGEGDVLGILIASRRSCTLSACHVSSQIQLLVAVTI